MLTSRTAPPLEQIRGGDDPLPCPKPTRQPAGQSAEFVCQNLRFLPADNEMSLMRS
jgi:hypothetical protein